MTKRQLFFVFLVLFSIKTFAQNLKEKQPLRTVLGALERRYELTFTYADENIEGIFIVPPSGNFDLDETLQYLHQQTRLVFQKLNDRFIAISKSDEREICGIIIDDKTGEHIVGATIQADKKAAISNDDGYFELKRLSDTSTLSIRFVGYKTLTTRVQEITETSCDTFYLKQNVYKLKEVVVANFIAEGIDINSDGSIKINAETLGILPGLTDPDVLQTIQALPGIQSINETVSDINVRGGTNDQNLIFWEGIKMYQSGHFFGLISAFNPYLIKEVTLIKNGTSAALSDGVSSIIDVRTDDQVSQKASGGAGINMINADFFIKFPLSKKISLQVSGRRSISDLYQTPTYDQYFNRVFRNTDVTTSSNPVSDTLIESNEKFNFHDVSVKFLYDISNKDKLRFNFLRVYNKINYQENAVVNNMLESKTSGLEQQSRASSMSYRRLWSNKLLTTAQLYFSEYELGAINFDVLNDQRLIQENKILDIGLKLDARLALTNTFDLLTGYQFFEVGISNLEEINNPDYRRYIKKVIRSHAFFTEGNYSSKSNDTNIRMGLRGNYFEKFDRFIFEPRLAFSQRFLEHFSIEVLAEIKSQTTTQVIDLQNDFLGVEKRRWVLSNEDDIPIVESRQVSSGIHYQHNNFLISLDGYFKRVKGITSSSQGFQNQFQYIRKSGNYEVTGLDFLINQRLGDFTTWLSYSYANNTYTFPEFIPPAFPNNLDVKHTSTFGSSYKLKNFQISAGLNWHTGKPYTEPLEVAEGEIIYDTPNSSRLDEYLRIDLSAKYRFQMSQRVRGEFGASLWNLLNNQNIVSTYYQVNDNGTLETIQQYALGFTPNFMFRVNF